jgi:acetyl esterase/lipase
LKQEISMKAKFQTIYILLLLMVTACGSPAAQSANPPKTQRPESFQRDIVYCTMEGVELKMDIYTPGGSEKKPAIVYIHGGSWVRGDKSDVIGKDAPALVKAGIVVFSIDYRLAPKYKFPAMIEDAKCAVRSIRAHAAEYNVDPDHIGAYGGSAGGHIALLLATTDESAGFDVGEYLDYSSRVQAVVDLFAPSDLTRLYQLKTVPSMRDTFLESDLVRASPITYISADDPPVLIMHGTLDRMVPPEQSQDLYEVLLARGVSAKLIMVENGKHGFSTSEIEKPTRAEISQIIADFFAEALR